MTTPGRRATPTAVKRVNGNPGRRPLPTVDAEVRPESAIPDRPEHLKGAAAEEWDRITTLLHDLKVIAHLDKGGLAMLCTQWGRYVAAEERIEAENEKNPTAAGMFVSTPNGFPVQSPWLAVSNKAQESYKAWCNEFGLTPAARVRLVPMTSPQQDMFGNDLGDADHPAPPPGTDRFFVQ